MNSTHLLLPYMPYEITPNVYTEGGFSALIEHPMNITRFVTRTRRRISLWLETRMLVFEMFGSSCNEFRSLSSSDKFRILVFRCAQIFLVADSDRCLWNFSPLQHYRQAHPMGSQGRSRRPWGILVLSRPSLQCVITEERQCRFLPSMTHEEKIRCTLAIGW